MRSFFVSLVVLACASLASARGVQTSGLSKSPVPRLALDQSRNPDAHQHDKRLLCLNLLGLCVDVLGSSGIDGDINNCGRCCNRCPSSWANGKGGAKCVEGVCLPKDCADGFTLNPRRQACVSLQTDATNCGALNKVCAIQGASSQRCVGGKCQATACASGLTLTPSGTCKNLQQDATNCGALNNVCAVAGASSQQCVSGQCQATACVSGLTLSSNGACIDLTTNVGNCGALNKPCAVAGASSQQCVSGQCQATACVSGLTLSSNGACIDLTTNVGNCGALNKPCAVAGASSQQCVSGQCQATACVSGLTLSSNGACIDLTTSLGNCGGLGLACAVPGATSQYCSSGKCYAYACSPGLTLSPSGTCLDLSTSEENCGAIGVACSTTYNNGGAGSCVNGRCFATCDAGYVFDTQYNFCRPFDPLNCGAIGRQCSIAHASKQACVGGICLAQLCVSGYTPSLDATACVLGASGRARAKRAVETQRKTLCPADETACPIAGSTSFDVVKAQLSLSEVGAFELLSAAGGYECLDTRASLESCGGCASTGEGQDCTAISHAGNVGCEAGRCVVLSCARGYKPSLAGDRCVRKRHARLIGTASGGENATLATRHLRHHGSHHHRRQSHQVEIRPQS